MKCSFLKFFILTCLAGCLPQEEVVTVEQVSGRPAPEADFGFGVRQVPPSGNAGDDVDSDGVDDGYDNCVGSFNPEQRDSDLDRIGNPCDVVFNSTMPPITPQRDIWSNRKIYVSFWKFAGSSDPYLISDIEDRLVGRKRRNVADVIHGATLGNVRVGFGIDKQWRSLSRTRSEYAGMPNAARAQRQEALDAVERSGVLLEYDTVMMVFEGIHQSGRWVTSACEATVLHRDHDFSNPHSFTPFISIPVDPVSGQTWCADSVNVLAHEVGHTMGMFHVGRVTCRQKANAVGPSFLSYQSYDGDCGGPEGSDAEFRGYHPMNLMGTGSSGFVNSQRSDAGWLDSQSIETVFAGESRFIEVADRDSVMGARSISIPLGRSLDGRNVGIWVDHHPAPDLSIYSGQRLGPLNKEFGGFGLIWYATAGAAFIDNQVDGLDAVTFAQSSVEGSPGREGDLRAGEAMFDPYRGVSVTAYENETENTGLYFVERSQLSLSQQFVHLNDRLNAESSAVITMTPTQQSVRISQFRLSGTDAGNFMLSHSCPSFLIVGSSCDITISIKSGTVKDGRKRRFAQIRFETSDALMPSPSIEVMADFRLSTKTKPTSPVWVMEEKPFS